MRNFTKTKTKKWSNKKFSDYKDASKQISYEQVQYIGQYNNHKLYGHIPDKVNDKNYSNSLEKGLRNRDSQHGVKYIKDTMFKITTSDDWRLYTNKLYQDANGDYLAIFNKEARHKEITRKIVELKLEIITEASIFPDHLFNSQEYSGIGLVGDIEYLSQNDECIV